MATRDRDLLDEIEADLLRGESLSNVLRKVIVLGGRMNSGALRDWASRELNGYDSSSERFEVPGYRRVAAEIHVDAVTINGDIFGQRINVADLPAQAQRIVGEILPLPYSIAALEALLRDVKENEPIRVSLPDSLQLARAIDAQNAQPNQQITALYWALPRASVAAVIDRIWTKLAELVGELTAALPDRDSEPTSDDAAAAVTFVVTGKRSNVSYSNARASGNARATSSQNAPGRDPDPSWWTLGRKVGAFVVGCCVVAGAVIAYLTYIK